MVSRIVIECRIRGEGNDCFGSASRLPWVDGERSSPAEADIFCDGRSKRYRMATLRSGLRTPVLPSAHLLHGRKKAELECKTRREGAYETQIYIE